MTYGPSHYHKTDAGTGLSALLDMLTYKRPHGSDTERAFINRFLRPLGAEPDAFGNLWLDIPNADGATPILWSCHTDSVHHKAGRQTVAIENGMAHVVAMQGGRKLSNCLGADDAAGVWLMREMILARVPGTYVFHRGEEVGGLGSSWLAKTHPNWFEAFDAAIALDRAGYGDVITHQGFQRCCSQAFAESLTAILGGEYLPDDTGVFTDTANYTDLVGECTNISVGYFRQHGPMEALDLDFILALRDTLIAADWSALVIERKPGDPDPDWQVYGLWSRGYGDDDRDGAAYGDRRETYGRGWIGLLRYVEDNPQAVADFLDRMGVTVADLEDASPWGHA